MRSKTEEMSLSFSEGRKAERRHSPRERKARAVPSRCSRASRLADLSALLGVPLRVEEEAGPALSLIQQEPLMAVAGVAAQKKSGETGSGY